MSNELETKLRGLINELQGLYRQCTADIVEIKRNITALEEKVIVLEKKTQTELLEYKNEYSLRPISLLKNALDKIEDLESILLEYFKIMWDKKRVPNVGEVKRWIKQLEGI